jgi:hypothetical protein
MTLVSLIAREIGGQSLTHPGNRGLFAPGSTINGTTQGDVDIYGHDAYPLGFDCANPYKWPAGHLPTYFHDSHETQSPSTFFSLNEFQGGSFDPWGGLVRNSLLVFFKAFYLEKTIGVANHASTI